MDHLSKRARAADRDLAVEYVESAWVDGQLTREEYDERVGLVLGASTVGDLEHHLRDLQGVPAGLFRPQPPHDPAPRPVAEEPVRSTRTGAGRAWAAGLVAVAVVAVGGGVLTSGGPETRSDQPVEGHPVASATYENFVRALREETGAKVVFEVVVEDGTFRVKYPATVSGGRYIERTWDGGWGPSTNGDTTLPRLNLRSVDPAWVQHGTDEAWAALAEPEHGSTTISVDVVDGVRTCVRAVAHEGDDESRVDVDCEGNLVG